LPGSAGPSTVDQPTSASASRASSDGRKVLGINIPEVFAELTQAFERYERTLVANDVAEPDRLFWESPLALC
jgi:hypothetical protein